MLSLMHHPNLVSLAGYCGDAYHRLLVNENMLLGSLEDNLSGISSISLIPSMSGNISFTCYNIISRLCNEKQVKTAYDGMDYFMEDPQITFETQNSQ